MGGRGSDRVADKENWEKKKKSCPVSTDRHSLKKKTPKKRHHFSIDITHFCNIACVRIR